MKLTITLAALATTMTASAADFFVYYGCYTGDKTGSKGIYVSRFNSDNGEWSAPELAGETGSPSFLAVHPDGKHLYSVGEVSVPGQTGGGVTAWGIDKSSGRLSKINEVSSVGAGPCHINLAPDAKLAMVANYGGGSAASYEVKADGSLSEAVSFHQHEGGSVNERRQKSPHAHSANFSPDGCFAFIADLGLDKVMIYKTGVGGKTTSHGSVGVPPGSGPRHFAFHPNGKFAFTNGEMLLNVTSFRYDSENGKLDPIETVSCLPAGDEFSDKYSTAEIRVHPNGKFVYCSLRQHDTIARFAFDEASGKLRLVGNTKSGGNIPRNFNMDPSGKWLFAAHQNSHNVVLFKVNEETGDLTPTGREHKVGGCVCVRFVPVN
ncbi:MAG: lactonase family protein [Verrucomicrobiaceae bacterium]|nr:lactonase family protein [Verrucomicrobiaceae bacterium]